MAVMVVVIFGLFMVVLDITIVNIAIPNLQTDFGASLSDVSWVSTGYSLAEGIGIPLTPYFSALMGTSGSICCCWPSLRLARLSAAWHGASRC